jgi:hypothetical protein
VSPVVRVHSSTSVRVGIAANAASVAADLAAAEGAQGPVPFDFVMNLRTRPLR